MVAFVAAMLQGTALRAQTDPTPAIDYINQDNNGNVTVYGVLQTYGQSEKPKWMEATIRATDNSWSTTVSNPTNKNGSITKGESIKLPTVTVPKSGNYVVNVGVGGCHGWKTVYGTSRTIYVTKNETPQPGPKPPVQPQTKQKLVKPQWKQTSPSNVIGNQEITVSWTAVTNAIYYSVYLTHNGNRISDHKPTGTSQTIKIPNVSGTVFIGIIAVPTSYDRYDQSEELQTHFSVWQFKTINEDRWANHNNSITVYNDWNPSNNRRAVTTIPKGTKVNVRDKFTLNENESYALIWTYNKEQGNYSGNMYVKSNDLREVAPQVQPTINSFKTDKTGYGTNTQVTFSGSASNFNSWKIVWLKNGKEADEVTKIQHGSNISANGIVTSTEYNGAVLYVYPQTYGGGTPVKETVRFGVVLPPPTVKPTISSFKANKEWYNINEQVIFSGSASNFGSWEIIWLKNGREADPIVSIQHGSNIYYANGIVTSAEYNGAVLYVYPQANRGGTPVKGNVSFGVVSPSPRPNQQPSPVSTPTSINLTAPTSPEFKVGDPIDIGISVTKSTEFSHYNIFVKKDGADKKSFLNNTGNFWQTLNTNGFETGDYSIWVVSYWPEVKKEVHKFKLIEILSQEDYEKIFLSNSYNDKFAYWCGKVSNDAYSGSENTAMKTLEFDSIAPKHIKIFDNEVLTYYVGIKKLEKQINEKTLITMIAIKGTDPKKLSNLMIDAFAYPVIWKTGQPSVEYVGLNPLLRTGQALIELIDQIPEVHGGFFACAKAIWEKINIDSNSLYIVTGHSLGGAIAELISLHLAEAEKDNKKIIPVRNIISYGFASPPVGDGDLRSHAQKLGIRNRIHKLHNALDIIPKAGWAAFSIAGDKKLFWGKAGHNMESVYLPELLKKINNSIDALPFTTEYDEPAPPQSAPIPPPINTISAKTDNAIPINQPQTYTSSHFTRIGNATLRNTDGKNFIGDINVTNGFRFTINSNTASTVNVDIVYSSDNRNGKLIVNGTAQNINFPSTNWNWGTKTVQVSLRQGANTIEFYGGVPTRNDYAPDIAEIKVYDNATQTTPISQPQTYTTYHFTRIGSATLVSSGGKSYIGDINETNGFRFTINSNSINTVNFDIIYSSDHRNGKLIVNGMAQNISFPSTNWNWGTRTVQVSLRQGTNTIEFYGGVPTRNDWAPDIAEIKVY